MLFITYFVIDIARERASFYPQKILLNWSSFQKWSSRSYSSCGVSSDRRYVWVYEIDAGVRAYSQVLHQEFVSHMPGFLLCNINSHYMKWQNFYFFVSIPIIWMWPNPSTFQRLVGPGCFSNKACQLLLYSKFGSLSNASSISVQKLDLRTVNFFSDQLTLQTPAPALGFRSCVWSRAYFESPDWNPGGLFFTIG